MASTKKPMPAFAAKTAGKPSGKPAGKPSGKPVPAFLAKASPMGGKKPADAMGGGAKKATPSNIGVGGRGMVAPKKK